MLCREVSARIFSRQGNPFACRPSHSDLCNDTNIQPTPRPVGASLLAMAVGQAIPILDVPASSRASPAPTVICAMTTIFKAAKPVGASLLAMAVGQAIPMLDVPASSRASPAPTVICAMTQIFKQPQNLWERACSRWHLYRRRNFSWQWPTADPPRNDRARAGRVRTGNRQSRRRGSAGSTARCRSGRGSPDRIPAYRGRPCSARQ